MFLGQFTHQLDSKGRLTIPVRFRDSLAAGGYVTQGYDRNLIVYTTDSFQRLARQANALTTTTPDARAIRRVIFGGAAEQQLDSVGRVLIPPFLREYAQLNSEVTIVGAGDYFEIWAAEVWAAELPGLSDPQTNSERFSAFELSAG